MWTIGELACATICLCVPTLRPLMGRAGGNAYRRHSLADLESANVAGSDAGGPAKKNGEAVGTSTAEVVCDCMLNIVS
jgi:hypothetical protein